MDNRCGNGRCGAVFEPQRYHDTEGVRSLPLPWNGQPALKLVPLVNSTSTRAAWSTSNRLAVSFTSWTTFGASLLAPGTAVGCVEWRLVGCGLKFGWLPSGLRQTDMASQAAAGMFGATL